MMTYNAAIESLLKTASTSNAIEAGIKQIAKKFHVSEKILKTYDNGIKLIGIYDKNDQLINQYHA